MPLSAGDSANRISRWVKGLSSAIMEPIQMSRNGTYADDISRSLPPVTALWPTPAQQDGSEAKS